MVDSDKDLALLTGEPGDIFKTPTWYQFERGWKSNPNGPALIATHQSPDHLASIVDKKNTSEHSCLTWSYSEMRLGAARIAKTLEDQGVKRGSIIATMLPNGIEWSLFFWVTAMLQLTIVPLDSTLVTPGREDQLKFFMETLKPGLVVVAGVKDAAGFDTTAADLAKEAVKVVCRGNTQDTPSGWHLMSALAASSNVTEDTIQVHQDETLEDSGNRRSAVLFTSGTSTGRPKGCPHTVRTLGASLTFCSELSDMRAHPRVLVHTVNFRGIHLACSSAAWYFGGCVILAGELFSPKLTLDVIETHRAEWIMCVPAMLHTIAECPSYSADRVKSVYFAAVAGDIVTKGLVNLAQKLFPGAQVRNTFGMSEGIGIIGYPAPLSSIPFFSDISTAGTVLSNGAIKICSLDKTILSRGQTGEVHFSGPTMIKGYYNGEQTELFYADEQGRNWVITGDQGVIDQDGYVYILGRSKDVIMRNGVPLSPAVIEVFLQSKLGIQAQAFGIPDRVTGTEPCIVVKPTHSSATTLSHLQSASPASSDLQSSTLPDLVSSSLGRDYKPKVVTTLQELGFEDWPKNETGKIVKRVLAEKMLEWLSERDDRVDEKQLR